METRNNTGVWIDGKQAIIVKLNNGSETLEKISSGIESRVRTRGEGKKFTRMGSHFATFETNKEEKHKHKMNDYFKNVIEKIKDADSVLIIGPAESKLGLQKAISQSKNIAPKQVMVDAEDHLTDNQVAAKVREYFNNNK